jgi:hypothetical protein
MDKQVIEIQCYSEMDINETPLKFQNFLYEFLDKMKKEKKILKAKNNNYILKAVRRDALELLNLKVLDSASTKIPYFIVKIFEIGNDFENEGLNIELSKTTIKIKKKSVQP